MIKKPSKYQIFKIMDAIRIEEYPTLISLPYIAFKQEQIPAKRMRRMLALFDSTLRFLTMVAVCEFFRLEETNQLLSESISQNIGLFNLNEWFSFTKSFLMSLQAHSKLYCRQLSLFYFKQDGTESEYLEIIKEFLKLIEESNNAEFDLRLSGPRVEVQSAA